MGNTKEELKKLHAEILKDMNNKDLKSANDKAEKLYDLAHKLHGTVQQ